MCTGDVQAPQTAVPAGGLGPLGERFVRLWQRIRRAGAADTAELVWHALEAHYAEPHRHYHHAGHLSHCLRQFDLASGQLMRPDEVETAIWFHDVIIVPGRTDNEARSAAYFRELADSVLPADFIDAVVDLILYTTHRTIPADIDHRFICDIDLSSLGSAWESFMGNSTAIEAEFAGPRDEYVRRETGFLRALLERPRIFLTDFFHERYEAQARGNIRRFLRLLTESTAA